MEDHIWQTTATMYSSLFEKPKMTETLLKKPPVKYIVDIVLQTSKVTGFAEGVFKEEELTKEYLSIYKEAKFDFLRKVIALLGETLNEQIDVNPVKIAAGLEPEKTNMLLQAFYRAAMKFKEGKDARKIKPRSTKEKASLEIKPKVEDKIEKKEDPVDDFFEKAEPERAQLRNIDEKLETEKQVKSVQNLIQNLTQNIQPINKSIDYVDENVENMNKEMNFWRVQYLESKTQYQREVSQTEEHLQPLYHMLAELEQKIHEKRDKIQTVKAQTLQNELKSRQLLFSAVSTK